MTEQLLNIIVDNLAVVIFKRKQPLVGFMGQKILHPFVHKQKQIMRGNKKFVENFYEKPETNNELLSECVRFDIKHDGSCGALVWNNDRDCYEPFARFDVKKNKENKFENNLKNSSWICCEPEPINLDATHWPHFRPCYEDVKGYKWHIKAFELAKNNLTKMSDVVSVEYMGKKFNWNKSDSVDDDAVMIIHGSMGIDIPKELRTFDGFRNIFVALPTIEGIIAYTKDNVPIKIKRDGYEGLKWPGEPATYLEKYGLNKSLSSHVALV